MAEKRFNLISKTIKMITTIAFDADDTLWHNERIFISTKERYASLLANYHDAEWINERLDETESRNILHFGYGVKAFTLSMIETACELTEGRISGKEIAEIVGFAKGMLASPIEVLEGVEEAVRKLSVGYRLMVITKGDLFDQEEKIARSGLGDYFEAVEILSKKNKEAYQNILSKYRLDPSEFLMVGNSLKSDILPVLEAGAKAVHIPYETEWFHEMVSEDELAGKEFTRLDNMGGIFDFLNGLPKG